MKRSATVTFLGMLLALAPGCIDAYTERIGPPLPAKPPDAPVAVFFNQTPVEPFVEIGRIHVRSSEDLPAVVTAAQAEARTLGADAIVIDLRYHYESVPVYFDAAGNPYTPPTPRLNARAMAIVFTAPPPAPPPPFPR